MRKQKSKIQNMLLDYLIHRFSRNVWDLMHLIKHDVFHVFDAKCIVTQPVVLKAAVEIRNIWL